MFIEVLHGRVVLGLLTAVLGFCGQVFGFWRDLITILSDGVTTTLSDDTEDERGSGTFYQQHHSFHTQLGQFKVRLSVCLCACVWVGL